MILVVKTISVPKPKIMPRQQGAASELSVEKATHARIEELCSSSAVHTTLSLSFQISPAAVKWILPSRLGQFVQLAMVYRGLYDGLNSR